MKACHFYKLSENKIAVYWLGLHVGYAHRSSSGWLLNLPSSYWDEMPQISYELESFTAA